MFHGFMKVGLNGWKERETRGEREGERERGKKKKMRENDASSLKSFYRSLMKMDDYFMQLNPFKRRWKHKQTFKIGIRNS